MTISWKLSALPFGIPSGFELVCDYPVKHPTRKEVGALVRNKRTGVCMMAIRGNLVNVS